MNGLFFLIEYDIYNIFAKRKKKKKLNDFVVDLKLNWFNKFQK